MRTRVQRTRVRCPSYGRPKSRSGESAVLFAKIRCFSALFPKLLEQMFYMKYVYRGVRRHGHALTLLYTSYN